MLLFSLLLQLPPQSIPTGWAFDENGELRACNVELLLVAGDSDNPIRGSEHSRIDGEVPAAQVAAPQQQRPRWDKSTGHEQSDQGADRPAINNSSIFAPPEADQEPKA